MIALLKSRGVETNGYRDALEDIISDKDSFDDRASNFESEFDSRIAFEKAKSNFRDSIEEWIKISSQSQKLWFRFHFFLLRGCYRRDSLFRELVRDSMLAIGFSNYNALQDALDKQTFGLNDFSSVDGTSTETLFLMHVVTLRYMLARVRDKGMVNYTTWSLSLIRELGVDEFSDGFLYANTKDVQMNMDYSGMSGDHLTLALGPNQAQFGWHQEICRLAEIPTNSDYSRLTYLCNSNISVAGAICQQILYNQRNRMNISSVSSQVTRSSYSDPMSVRIADTWYVSAYTLQPGLLLKKSGVTLGDMDYYSKYNDNFNKLWDLQPFNFDINKLITSGPLAVPRVFVPFPLAIGPNPVDNVSDITQLMEMTLGNMLLSDPTNEDYGRDFDDAVLSVAPIIAGSLPISDIRYTGSSRTGNKRDYIEGKGIPLFMAYDKIFKDSNNLLH